MGRFESFSTQFVQAIGKKEGNVSPEIVQSASFGYGNSQTAEGIFDGSVAKPLYSRVGNPTTGKLEQLLAQMDGGVGAIATSSGMAASTLAMMSILASGDEVISVGGLFGGTYTLFSETLDRFGVKTSFFDVEEFEAISAAVTAQTKVIFLESVGNPNMRLSDIEKIAQIANDHGVLLAVDNTITPLSVAPLKLGADMVIYSTTKIISGNAAVLGGAVVFREVDVKHDKILSDRYLPLHKFVNKVGKMAFMANAKKRGMRDLGMSASAHSSYLTMLGLETLPLRMDRVVSSVETVAKGLEAAGLLVRHPSLPSHEQHDQYKDQFSQGCGTLLTLDFATKEQAFAFLDASDLITITANIGDSRTLGLHMASTIYSDFDPATREFLGITDGLVRISIGLENPQDIIDDFVKAYQASL